MPSTLHDMENRLKTNYEWKIVRIKWRIRRHWTTIDWLRGREHAKYATQKQPRSGWMPFEVFGDWRSVRWVSCRVAFISAERQKGLTFDGSERVVLWLQVADAASRCTTTMKTAKPLLRWRKAARSACKMHILDYKCRLQNVHVLPDRMWEMRCAIAANEVRLKIQQQRKHTRAATTTLYSELRWWK